MSSSSNAQNQARTDMTNLLQTTQEQGGTPTIRATNLIHNFVQLCRQAAGTDDIATVKSYLNEFDKQATAYGEAIGEPQGSTRTGGASQ